MEGLLLVFPLLVLRPRALQLLSKLAHGLRLHSAACLLLAGTIMTIFLAMPQNATELEILLSFPSLYSDICDCMDFYEFSREEL